MTHHLPTVYNLSSLQLHPDGSRVLPSASQNQKPRYAARVVQDSRGNWFARDAAGSGAVGRYRKVKEVKGYKEEYDEQQNDVHDVEEDELFERQEEGTTGQRHNSRRAKRQKFLQDYDFLTPTPSDGSDPTHALPSSVTLSLSSSVNFRIYCPCRTYSNLYTILQARTITSGDSYSMLQKSIVRGGNRID